MRDIKRQINGDMGDMQNEKNVQNRSNPHPIPTTPPSPTRPNGQRGRMAILMLGVLGMSALGFVLLASGCKNRDFGSTSDGRHASDESLPVFESSAASDNYNQVTEIEPASATAPIFDPVPVAPVMPQTHTVARGDTLWSIAKRYYADGKRWRDIAEANHIQNPRQLTVGDTLTLP